jgi:hypothetical protein
VGEWRRGPLFTASTERRESVCLKERRIGPMARRGVVSPLRGLSCSMVIPWAYPHGYVVSPLSGLLT